MGTNKRWNNPCGPDRPNWGHAFCRLPGSGHNYHDFGQDHCPLDDGDCNNDDEEPVTGWPNGGHGWWMAIGQTERAPPHPTTPNSCCLQPSKAFAFVMDASHTCTKDYPGH